MVEKTQNDVGYLSALKPTTMQGKKKNGATFTVACV